ncbi:hypothetical protein ACXR2W_06000 [Leucobacter sp. HY1908]
MTKKKWGLGSDHYHLRPQVNERSGYLRRHDKVTPQKIGDSGRVIWDTSQIEFDLIRESPIERSLERLRNTLPEFIWNTAALEGNLFTLPEVRTLLDGVTVGGKRVEDANQIIALSEAMNTMIEMVRDGSFNLSAETSQSINRTVAQYEIIDPGVFRGQGTVMGGGGTVRLTDGSDIDGDDPGKGGEQMVVDYANLLAALESVIDPRERALAYFASATRSQFYYDGNKRTARIMMTGHLIASGYEAVSVPVARRLEFNQGLESLFRDSDATSIMAFLTTCTPPDAQR